jgi:hypothetical protein
VPIGLQEDVAQIDADAKDHSPCGRPRLVPFAKTLLDGHGALNSVRDALKDGQQAIARRIDQTSVVRLEVPSKHGEGFGESGDGPLLVLAHETAVAGHVCAQDGRESSISVSHAVPPSCHAELARDDVWEPSV